MDESINIFAALRPSLQGIAFSILGSHAEALAIVDSVAITFEWRSAALEAHADPAAWLVSETYRLARDRWRSGTKLQEIPEWDSLAPPQELAELTEEILAAAFVLLEELEPDARTAFLLHDIFGADFMEISLTLGRSEPDCRILVEDARRHVRQYQDRQAP